MNRKKTTNSPETDWLEMQKKYLDACRVFTHFIPGTDGITGQASNPMSDAAEAWWRAIAPSMPKENAEYINNILDQSKVYYFLGDQFIKMLNLTAKSGKNRSTWESILNTQIEEMKKVFCKMQNDSKEVAHKMAGTWQLMPMDTLHRTFSLCSLMPGDFLGAFKHDDMHKMSDKFLSIPGVGYTRESQEKLQEGIRLLNEYQKVSQEYNQNLSNVAVQAIDKMQQKIMVMLKEGKELKSLREVYDLWVDCNEESYASFVLTPEYSSLYGRLTNALMAVKQHGRNIIDENLRALNMPTQKGINTLHKRQYDMSRKQKTDMKNIEALQQELAELHNQLKRTRAGNSSKSSVPAEKRKTSKAVVIDISKKRKARTNTSRSRKKRNQHVKKDKMIVIKI